jgi:hypothetical protein
MMRKLGTIALALIILSGIILIPAAPAAFAEDQDYKILGSIGGPTNAVAVSGNNVYVGKGTSIIILENTGGSLRQKGTQLNLPSFVSDLKIEGKTLYAAAGSAGLYIIDISDPLKPVEKGVYSSSGFAESVVVSGGTAYLANGSEGLQIIDTSNPANPVALGQAFKGKYAFGVAVSANNAYIAAADDGLLTVDISRNTAPKELASLDTPGVARNVAVSDKYAYVADDWKGVSIVDIADPAAPKQAKTINTAGRAHGLALDKNNLYVADAYMGVRVFDVSSLSAPKDLTSFIPADSQAVRVLVNNGLLFCADRSNGILCFDIGKPANLQLKGFYSHTVPIPLYLPEKLANLDNGKDIARLVVLGVLDKDKIDPQKEITRAEFSVLLCKALQAGNVSGVKKASFIDVPASHWAFGYVENAVRLGLIGSRDKTHFDPEGTMSYADVAACLLQLVNRRPATGKWPDNCINAAEKLGLNTVFCGQDFNQNVQRGNAMAMLSKVACQIPDTKTNMTLLQSKFGVQLQAFPMQGNEAAVRGKYAYVSAGTSGFSVVDVQNPANPQQVAHIDLPGFTSFIRIYGEYTYILTTNRVYVVDIKDPLHPIVTYMVSSNSGGPARGVDIDSGKMYVADEWGYKLYSLKDPARPEFLKQHEMVNDRFVFKCATSDIAVRNGIAYFPMEFDGVKIYDVSDDNTAKHLSTYSIKNVDYYVFYTNVQFFGSKAFVKSSSRNGIEILDVSDIRNPKPLGLLENLDSTQFNYRMGLYKNYALLPNGSNGIHIADVSDPAAIKTVADVNTVGTPVNVTVEEDRAYIADGLGGVCILGLSKSAMRDGAAPLSGSAPAVKTSYVFQSLLFRGPVAEKCVLSTGKTLAVLNSQRAVFTQTLTVSNTKDSGPGSLRWCLENIKKGGRILFDTSVFDPSKPETIYILNTLEPYSGYMTLDASNAGVILDGSRSKDGASCIWINSDENVIKGLKIQNFDGTAISICGRDNIIGGSRVKGNSPSGEGNVVIKTLGIGIGGQGATDNIIVGNNVGIDSDGVTPAGNNGGIDLRGEASRNVIGVDIPEYRNIVGANHSYGISTMLSSFGNLFEGNYAGTDASGLKAAGNHSQGITFELSGYGNIVRNNVCCGNGRSGINIWDNGGSFNVIVGNSVGIGADGRTEIPNKEGTLAMGGGVGGGSYYNVIGGKQADTANRLFPVHNVGMGEAQGIYDTVYNGRVYKYSNADRY